MALMKLSVATHMIQADVIVVYGMLNAKPRTARFRNHVILYEPASR